MALHRKIAIYLTRGESIFPMDSYAGVKRKPLDTKKKSILDELQKIISEQKRAMIDLDGTIHKYSKGYADGTIYDDAFNGAKEVINWLRNRGYEIVIFTTRASRENSGEMGGDSHYKEISKVEMWLKDKGIYFDRITAEKLGADFYIDDKAIRIEGGDWGAVKSKIEEMEGEQIEK